MKLRLGLLAALTCTPLSALAQAPAQPARTDGAQAASDTVTVTARKREESVQDVPMAVTVLSADAIEDAGGIKNIGDLAAMAPGIQFTNTGNINAELNIRGSGAGTVRTANTDSPIAILRDGGSVVVGNIGGRAFARGDLFDLQRVEVIRGPQGVLYGQSTTGGVVNAISQRPLPEFGYAAQMSHNFTVEEFAAEGVLNVPILEDALALRLGLQHENRGEGHFYNVLTQKYGDLNRYTGGRASLLWTPTEELEVYLAVDGSDEQGPSNRVKSLTLGLNDPDGAYNFGHNTRDRSDRELATTVLNVDWDTGLGRLTSVSNWRSRETEFLQDEDGTAPGYARNPTGGAPCQGTRACETLFADDSELWSQEFRFDFDLPENWSLLVGGSTEVRNNDFFTVSRGRTVSATNLAPSPNQNTASISTSIDQFYGVFATLGWSPTDRLDLSGGGRYSETHKKFETFSVQRNVGGLATGALCPFDVVIDVTYPAACRVRGFNDDAATDNFSPAISALYKVTDDFRVFFSFARGFRAGGFNANFTLINASPAPGQPTADPSFGNETSNAYEVGAKGEAFGALYSASYYFNQVEDLIVTLNSTDTGGQTRNFRRNGGEAETQGIDFEANGRFADLLGGALSYSVGANWFKGDYVDGPFAGQEVEGQPEWQGTLGLTWRRPLMSDVRLFAGANYRLQRGGFTAVSGNTNTVALEEPDDVSARLGLETDTWRLTVEGTNLLDNDDPRLRDAVTAAFPQGQRLIFGDRREVLVRASYKFGGEQ